MQEVRSASAARHGFHPLWWAALALLIANDHLLKGAGVVPSVVTGKLSDVAGLFVAPILLSRLIQRGQRYSAPLAGLAFLAVGITFALVNLSQTFANGLTMLPSALGFPSRLWADSSDLWALLVLPIAWRLQCPKVNTQLRGPREVVCSERWSRFGVVSGGLACLATSTHVEVVVTSSYLFNATRYELSVEVHPAREGFDCDALKDDPAAALSRGEFQDGTCATIPPFELLVLDPHAQSEDDDELATVADHCDAAFVHIDGAAPTVLVWESSPQAYVPSTASESNFERVLSDPHSVLVEQLGAERFLAPGSHVQIFEVNDEDTMPASTCGRQQ